MTETRNKRYQLFEIEIQATIENHVQIKTIYFKRRYTVKRYVNHLIHETYKNILNLRMYEIEDTHDPELERVIILENQTGTTEVIIFIKRITQLH